MSTPWTILGGLLLLMSTCSIIVAVLLVVDRYRKPPWRGVTGGEVASAVFTGLRWVLRGFGLAMRWAVTVSGVTALLTAALLRIFPDLYRSPSDLGTWTGYAAFGAQFYLLLPAVAAIVAVTQLAAHLLAPRRRGTVAPPRTAPIPIPRAAWSPVPAGPVRSSVLIWKTAAETERLRREEIDTRPDVTADGALAWLHTEDLRDVAGQVLTSLDHEPASLVAAAPPPRRAGGIADCPRCARPVWTVDGIPAGHYPYRGARRPCPAPQRSGR
jgi:hypothetical protein